MTQFQSQPAPSAVTQLLHDARDGDRTAAASLMPLVYDQLRGLAAVVFSDERREHTLQPTALIHEAWLKLAGRMGSIEDRHHFFVLASRVMRQVLADHSRSKNRLKRLDGKRRVALDETDADQGSSAIDLVDLSDSLDRLSQLNERHAQVVELRVLGGLTIAEAAAALEVSHSTVEADWFTAKSWLRMELSGSRGA